MPSKSKAQQQFFAICEHNPSHARGKCPKMSREEMHKFSSTPTKGLPKKLSGRAKKGWS